MKKIGILLLLVAILSSCGSQKDDGVEKDQLEEKIVTTDYVVGGKDNAHINVYGNILSNNVKNITSNIAGQVSVLQCTPGEKVYPGTVVARINPDKNSLAYQNNLVQINSLKSQLANLKQIRATTIANFDTKYRQLGVQESEIQNQLDTVNSTIGDDSQGLKNQLKIIEESLELLEKNQKSSINNIDDSIVNLKKTTFNSIESGLKRLREIYDIDENGNDTYEGYKDYLGVKDTGLKNDHIQKIREISEAFSKMDNTFSEFTNKQLAAEVNEIAQLFKQSSDVVNNSVSSLGSLSQQTIDALYGEFLGISNQLISVKNNLDTLVNNRNTTKLNFQAKKKELEAQKSQLLTQQTTLSSNIKTLSNNNQTLKEQYQDLENTKNSTIKEMDINILSVEQAINQLNISFKQDVLYAGTTGTIKTKHVSQGNTLQAGSPICTIVPDDNSLKLEIYSPQTLEKDMEFKYFYDGEFAGTGSIISEFPVRNAQTQNYTYEGKIDITKFKEGDYVDVQVISAVSQDEIWVPINYVFPKLDGYYVKVKNGENIENKKIQVGKMNNGEILITQGVDFGDTLQQ